ncbi:MAG: RNA polymerase sigma factor [Planctomycetota bacterium]
MLTQSKATELFEDKRLIRKFNAGDTDALRRIYEKYRPDLLSVARALLNDPATLEDVLHDVFVSFASQAGRFELTGSLKGYLAVCVANRARNIQRRKAPISPDRLPELRPGVTEQPGASKVAERAEQQRAVMSALAQLPAEQRQTVVLHVLAALRFREIAHQTGESINTIQSRYRYGIRKLRSLLNGQVDI